LLDGELVDDTDVDQTPKLDHDDVPISHGNTTLDQAGE